MGQRIQVNLPALPGAVPPVPLLPRADRVIE